MGAQPELLFPIIDRATALDAMRHARLSVQEAEERGWAKEVLEDEMEAFRRGWKRRLAELDLHGLPEDPFEVAETEESLRAELPCAECSHLYGRHKEGRCEVDGCDCKHGRLWEDYVDEGGCG